MEIPMDFSHVHHGLSRTPHRTPPPPSFGRQMRLADLHAGNRHGRLGGGKVFFGDAPWRWMTMYGDFEGAGVGDLEISRMWKWINSDDIIVINPLLIVM